MSRRRPGSHVVDPLRLLLVHEAARGDRAVGVAVPIASALLQFAAPDRYPILDYRAARSFGHRRRTSYPAAYGVRYFAACRHEQALHGVANLRTLDKALWAYDRHRHPPKRPHRNHDCRPMAG